MTTPTPADLGALKTAAWAAVHAAAKSGAAADYDASLVAMKATEDACELYRLAHHPNAFSVFAVADDAIGQPLSIYAIYASGTECVFDSERAPA